jgi:hypothetical protein
VKDTEFCAIIVIENSIKLSKKIVLKRKINYAKSSHLGQWDRLHWQSFIQSEIDVKEMVTVLRDGINPPIESCGGAPNNASALGCQV